MGEKDLYQILGVSHEADDKTIKSAYRKLAKKYHPDTNPGDKVVEARFKEATEAYHILSDPEKRKLYDRFGMAGVDGSMGADTGHTYGNGPFSGGFDFGNGGHYQEYHYSTGNMDDMFGDIFGDIFGGGFRHGFEEEAFAGQQGKNIHSEITITFEEAAFGCDRKIRFENGRLSPVEVHIPAGIDEGQSVRLKGKGDGPRGHEGDLLLKVHIMEKPGYERKGMDVYTTETVPYTTAALGGTAYFKTLYGSVQCNVPAGTRSGSKIRLKNKGIVSMKNPDRHGDEYVVIQIEVPQNISSEERRALENLRNVQARSRNGGAAC